ncbi:MAG: AraC family transcriptional regulator [Steroidobacteraceae bacterium]
MHRFPDWTPVEALKGAAIHMLSHDATEWRGIHCSVIRHQDWNVDDVMYDGHWIGLNLSTQALSFEARCGAKWASVFVPSHAYWVIPEGQPFSVRRGPPCYALCAVIDGAFLDSILGAHHELKEGVGHSNDVVSHVFRGLMDHAVNGDADPRATTALIHSLVFALASRHGTAAAAQLWRGALTQGQLTAIITWIKQNLERALTVEEIASHLGMKAAPFSRAFKRATGKTPWDFVIGTRLECAVNLLRRGRSVSVVAEECGFSDQAHLSRLFKRSYGISPAAFSARHRHQSLSIETPRTFDLAAPG